MAVVNGPGGYGVVTKALHWATLAALVTQFALGYAMSATEAYDALQPAHVALGLTILVLALARVGWRRVAGLPPWAERLTAGERRVAHVTERVLLASLFVIPLSGLALVSSGDDDLLPVHVGAHLVFFATLASHLGLVVRRRLLPRML
jgi:cytochrome b561